MGASGPSPLVNAVGVLTRSQYADRPPGHATRRPTWWGVLATIREHTAIVHRGAAIATRPAPRRCRAPQMMIARAAGTRQPTRRRRARVDAVDGRGVAIAAQGRAARLAIGMRPSMGWRRRTKGAIGDWLALSCDVASGEPGRERFLCPCSSARSSPSRHPRRGAGVGLHVGLRRWPAGSAGVRGRADLAAGQKRSGWRFAHRERRTHPAALARSPCTPRARRFLGRCAAVHVGEAPLRARPPSLATGAGAHGEGARASSIPAMSRLARA
jgi:hypothetical protein